MNDLPPAAGQDPWRAAQQRVNGRDIEDGRCPPCDDDGDTTDQEARRRRRPVYEYCSNELRAEATRKRILREAGRACLRIQAGQHNEWLTPPLNSYHRRLCHQLAEACGLCHTTVPCPGDDEGETKATHRTKPRLCGSTCESKWCKLSLDQAPANRCVLISKRKYGVVRAGQPLHVGGARGES